MGRGGNEECLRNGREIHLHIELGAECVDHRTNSSWNLKKKIFKEYKKSWDLCWQRTEEGIYVGMLVTL